MKTALVTLCIKRDAANARWMDAGLPSKVKYAKHIGANFINITEAKLGGSVAMEKYQIGEMLNKYDRIIYMDADLFVVSDAPNLFHVMPADHFGIFDESHGGEPRRLRTSLMDWLPKGHPCNFYANNGLFVCSKYHQWLFNINGLDRSLNTYEQTCMNVRLWDNWQVGGIKIHWLTKSWNWMPRTWIGGPDPGWVPEPQPDPCWVHHFPCHRPEERTAAINALNAKYGL
jgi:hypothetical protein